MERARFRTRMAVHLLVLVGGLALLVTAASALVRGASALALRFGLSPLVVGLTVVAFGTSAPELVVSAQAALAGAGGIAVGNVVGSNIANIALILGVAALVKPLASERAMLQRDLPLLVAATALASAFLLDREVLLWEGAVLTAALVAHLSWSLVAARRAAGAPEAAAPEAAAPEAAAPEASGAPAWQSAAFVALGLAGLVWGADLFVGAATALAERAGVPNAVIGLTVVAVGTSLPELATSAVAAARGEGAIAIGNVVGSNLFNALGILGVAALVRPLAAPGLQTLDLVVMGALTLAMGAMMWTGRRLSRWEGAALLTAYVGYVAFVIAGAV